MIEHIHSRGFVYRDLKPENIMITQDGYLKLIDFGFCKALANDTDRTFTPCGTLEYMAPEVLTRLGHGFEADWWSMGVLVFECFHMCTPFVIDDSEPDDTTIIKRIQNQHYLDGFSSPNNAPFVYHPSATPQAIALMANLMMHDPKWRSDAEGVRGSAFFADFSWPALIQRRLQPLTVPAASDPFDTGAFDPSDIVEADSGQRLLAMTPAPYNESESAWDATW